MENPTPLRLPAALPMWALASFVVTRLQLRNHLGEPHFVDRYCSETCGSEANGWAYNHPSGQRVVVILDVEREIAEFYGDPPELETVLQMLRVSLDDPRIINHEPVRIP